MVATKSSAKVFKKIPLHVYFELTDEKFSFSHVSSQMTIKILKGFIELETGIPFELQKLYYLDSGDLPDDQIIKKMDIVANAVVNMEVWHTWKQLIEACCANDIEWLHSLGVTKDTTFQTPTSEYMLPRQRREWIQQRANVALFIACHRNYHEMAKKLLMWGADINSTTALGRSPLHVAAAKNNGEVINLLLENGANVDLEDSNGCNPLSIASEFGHKGCERRLFMFRWQQRAKSQIPQFLNPPMMEFQYADSNYPKWKVGTYAQMYMQKLMPPTEFIGSAFDAPKRNWHRRSSMTSADKEKRESLASSKSAGRKPLSYHEWIDTKEKQAAKIRQEQRRQELLKLEEEKRRLNEIKRLQEAKDDLDRQRLSLVPAYAGMPSLDSQSHPFSSGLLQPLVPRQKYKLDPSLSAYEQWLKDKNESMAGFEQSASLLPYQQMIKEFCSRKCSHHHHYEQNQD